MLSTSVVNTTAIWINCTKKTTSAFLSLCFPISMLPCKWGSTLQGPPSPYLHCKAGEHQMVPEEKEESAEDDVTHNDKPGGQMPLHKSSIPLKDDVEGCIEAVDVKLWGGSQGPKRSVAVGINLLCCRHAKSILVFGSFHYEGRFLPHHPIGKLTTGGVTVASIRPDEDSQMIEIWAIFPHDFESHEWVLVSIWWKWDWTIDERESWSQGTSSGEVDVWSRLKILCSKAWAFRWATGNEEQ